MQPAKPSFLQYFEQKEQDEGITRQNNADERRPEGDLHVVSPHLTTCRSPQPNQEQALNLLPVLAPVCLSTLNARQIRLKQNQFSSSSKSRRMVPGRAEHQQGREAGFPLDAARPCQSS